MNWIRPQKYYDGGSRPPPASDDAEAAAAAVSAPAEDASEATTRQNGMLEPTVRPTAHQIFYIFGLHGVGAMLISGAINFAIAYGMYGNEERQIRLWQFPVTVAGDAAVTVILQCVITWLVELAVVRRDLRTGAVRPIGFFARPSHGRPRRGSSNSGGSSSGGSGSSSHSHRCRSCAAPLLRWLFLLDRHRAAAHLNGSGAANGGIGSPRTWLAFVVAQLERGLLAALPSFVLFWPVSVGALVAVGRWDGDDYVYGSRWAPEIFKALLGGLLGLVVTPFFAAFWVTRAGWPEVVETDDDGGKADARRS